MKSIKKYKNYSKRVFISTNYPIKFSNFKSLKWRNVKSQISKINKYRIKRIKEVVYKKKKKLILQKKIFKFIVNPLLKISKSFRIKKKFKHQMFKNFTKKKLLLYYSNQYSNNKINFSYNSKLKKIQNILLKPLLNIKIILWLLNYSLSIKQILQNIKQIKMMISNEKCFNNKKLNKGAIILFDKYFNKKFNREKFVKNNNIFSFLEVDFYVNILLVVKDIKELTINDNYLQISDHFNLTLLSYHK